MLAYLEQPPRVARKTTIDGITPRSGLPRPKAPAPCIASVGDGGAVRTSDGVSIGDVHGPEVLEDADLLVFPSWSTGLPLPSPSLVQHIRDAHERGAPWRGCAWERLRWPTVAFWTDGLPSPTGHEPTFCRIATVISRSRAARAH
jgi:hypothetical protein